MKIGVVTVNESYNCGSYLQAYALQKTLTDEFGADVVFLKNKTLSKNRLWYRLIQSGKFICTRNVARAKHILKVYLNFKRARKNFNIQNNFHGVSKVVYGSDTIWNINNSYFENEWRRYWGADYDGVKITYAASCGPTPAEKLLGRAELCSALDKISFVSVRDAETERFAEQVLGDKKPVYRVADPTVLLCKKGYEAIEAPCEDKNYILFYYFGNISESIKEQIKQYAKNTGRKIIVFGEKGVFADKYISNDPGLMLSYFRNADFVITNTFHGTIFSLIFNKQFVSFGADKQKVRDLLTQFGQFNRLKSPDEDFSELLKTEIDFTETNILIDQAREKSLEYLKRAINYSGEG